MKKIHLIRHAKSSWKDDSLADSDTIFDWCRAADESITELVIIGHNPALTNFCNELSNSNLKNIPTCGYAQLSIGEKCRWRKLAEGSAELTAFLRPKKLMKQHSSKTG
jgi:phosphohistidine phosphatase